MRQTIIKLIKHILFLLIIAVLFLPLIQQKKPLTELKPLNGYFATVENPLFELNTWFEGKYQQEKQKYIEQNIGFRNFFVRSYNEIYFRFFNQAKANGVKIGKENYLYEGSYIRAYLGTDFIGHDKIADKVFKLQKISDTLRSKGIDIIVVIAPGKGSFYPEYFPNEFDNSTKGTTNYEVYQKELNQSNIHFLDFNKWFLKMKRTSKYPLFPKTGIHWSSYGEVLALDSLAKYIEKIRNINMPKIHIDKVVLSDSMMHTDDDIEKSMNLLYDIKDLKMGYANLSFNDTASTITKPKMISVADSYFWGIFGRGLTGRLFKDQQFWYYNKKIYSDLYPNSLKVEDVNIKDEVEKNEVIILLSTDANLYKFSYGFIEQLYDAYYED